MTKAEKEYGRIRNEIFPFPPGAYMTHSIVPRCSTVNETADEASPVTLYNQALPLHSLCSDCPTCRNFQLTPKYERQATNYNYIFFDLRFIGSCSL